jgi:hypothetical protein
MMSDSPPQPEFRLCTPLREFPGMPQIVQRILRIRLHREWRNNGSTVFG